MRNAYTQSRGELVWDTWSNRLILRLSLQSENETNDPLKSGPALAGPAGPATPPLRVVTLVAVKEKTVVFERFTLVWRTNLVWNYK